MIENQEELRRRLEESGALQQGHFALSSGLHSGYYMQCALFLRFPGNASFAGKLLADSVRVLKPDFIVSPALGGLIVGHEVARHLCVPFIFCERREGLMQLKRFPHPDSGRFVVVEDVITTGGSSLETARVILSKGKVFWAATACIVDRSDGNACLPEPLISLWNVSFPNYSPEDCPYCKQGIPLTRPGSRNS
ncbi:MAG TPA: orotate phosphoribosyltransferase [Synergistaceae bacterium]|jgi:orotate phosphoribosyltransferase|nr:MAG: Orotate phosphoribosyltransferase [Synergistales bacterium 53_16]KUL04959.1 MAG: Orotate phosphoribosyltransferase [Synergistales bacterium 54_9]MDN5335553.1 orotate phosphoribosyltransferase [Synergistales bacterium]HAA48018.1 orotate phosphoribosyltransferase [Synergistaceae bacterium]HAG22109.1 orotate phosphoribosyltransferase [Synergistaceae bacterium]